MTRHTSPRVPLTGALVAGVLALSGCASSTGTEREETAPPAAGGAASCVAAVSYEGELYLQVETGPVTAGEALEGAEVPACDDTGSGEATATPVDAFAIDGVDARYAVMSEGGAGPMVYVVQEFAPGLVDAEPLPDDVAGALGLD